jgi:hypothetical protein
MADATPDHSSFRSGHGHSGVTPAPAPGVFPPSPPVPGSIEAARRAGRLVGEAYGEFAAWEKAFTDMFAAATFTGGIRPWDRLPAERRMEVILKVQRAYESLPKLPPSTSMEMARALRQGFEQGASIRYEAARFMTRAVWVVCELAKAFATG